MSSQSSLNITNEHLLLINIINTLYNDNLRQINSLTTSNNEIRNIIIGLLRNRNQTNNRFRNRYNNNNRESFIRNSSQGRVYPNNLQHFDHQIPQSNIHTWVNNSVPNSSQTRTYDNQRRNYNNQTRTTNFARAFQQFLEPVEVFPTQTQIEAATRRTMYCNIISPNNIACPISLENFNDTETVSVIRHCGHIFNTEHLNRWFRTNCRCPVCRYDIRNYNSLNLTDYISNERNINLSSPSIPLNETESSMSFSDTERNNNQTNSTQRTTSSTPYISSLFNNIINDITLLDIQNIGSNFTDASGNFTSDISDPTILFRIISTINNSHER